MVKRELYLKEIRPFYESKLIRQEKHYLFFDEIQNVNEFELVVNSFRAPNDIYRTYVLFIFIQHIFDRSKKPFNFEAFRLYKEHLY